MAGETVRVQGEGVGLQFFDVDEDSFYHLQNVVYFNYKNSGGVGEVAIVDEVDDETLYLGIDEGKKTHLPDNYLDDVADEDSYDADDDDDVYGKYKDNSKEDDSDF